MTLNELLAAGHSVPMNVKSSLGAIGASFMYFTIACAVDKEDEEPPRRPVEVSPDSGKPAAATFYEDVLPLIEARCLACHQSGGIAPFTLDSLEAARQHASAIRLATAERSMPPWLATSDGSCGNFRESIALTDAEIAVFGDWVEGGMAAGKARAIERVDLPHLEGATRLSTPIFTPEVDEHDAHAAHDEYRCFRFDAPVLDTQFLTGYSVTPGTPEIVHHAVAFVVNPDGPADIDGKTNGELMAELDGESPDRDGWPCFGAAGDGVRIAGVPVVWAPGQGIVEFPDASGVPLAPTDQLVIQMHYNLADPQSHGKTDQTTLELRLADHVERVGLFAVVDPFLNTLFTGESVLLPAGKSSVKYDWTQTMVDMEVDQIPDLKLAGVMPHMHELGRTFQMNLGGSTDRCGIAIPSWDFHWQRMYFYDEPLSLAATDSLKVTCDFDTSSRSEPVLPGWGTQNEMCAAIVYVTAPLEAFADAL
jgi:Copper type II ascorbate-dependent monooxygenase, C-terminal domain